MYKGTSRNMQRHGFRPIYTPKLNLEGFGKRKKDRLARNLLKTEPALVKALGPGSDFVATVYTKYKTDFEALNFDVKRCSAFLNVKAGVRMLTGRLWTDAAVKSMLRRMQTERRN